MEKTENRENQLEEDQGGNNDMGLLIGLIIGAVAGAASDRMLLQPKPKFTEADYEALKLENTKLRKLAEELNEENKELATAKEKNKQSSRNMEDNIEDLEDELASVKMKLKKAEREISEYKSKIFDLNARIGTLEAELEAKK